ncbi:7-dehydrocholesterol reductase-like [Gastrolobium bilobum]|uniref:7-dehydrocholesterol reductase-like n=1 Tax=Gastrolobium bilobum TaxID=150636 RepID=UPI002AB13E12|nr:7-dehydrocholesterol reductase-like [Gastrolobium bilobum]
MFLKILAFSGVDDLKRRIDSSHSEILDLEASHSRLHKHFKVSSSHAFLLSCINSIGVEGPISPTGNRPVYKANGVAAYLVTLITYLALWWFGIFNPTIVYDHLGEIYSALIFGSFVFCIFLYIKVHLPPSSTDSGSSGNIIIDFYWLKLGDPCTQGWDYLMIVPY